MKILIALFVIASLSGCATRLEKDNQIKRQLCESFAMAAQDFEFPSLKEPDVICVDEKTGERVYFQFTRNQSF